MWIKENFKRRSGSLQIFSVKPWERQRYYRCQKRKKTQVESLTSMWPEECIVRLVKSGIWIMLISRTTVCPETRKTTHIHDILGYIYVKHANRNCVYWWKSWWNLRGECRGEDKKEKFLLSKSWKMKMPDFVSIITCTVGEDDRDIFSCIMLSLFFLSVSIQLFCNDFYVFILTSISLLLTSCSFKKNLIHAIQKGSQQFLLLEPVQRHRFIFVNGIRYSRKLFSLMKYNAPCLTFF